MPINLILHHTINYKVNFENMQSQKNINKDRVDKALGEILTPALKPFIQRKMKAKYGQNWLQKARFALQEYHIKDNAPNWNDPQVVLKIILDNWNDVFRILQRFDHSERNLVSELLDVRNKVKHNNIDTFDYDYTRHSLYIMERLLTAIDANKAAQEVKQLKDELGSPPSVVQIENSPEVVISSQPAPVLNPNQCSVNTDDINWKQVCHTMLEKQQESQRIRRKATAMGFEVNVHVPLGLLERKQQQRRNENVDREEVYKLEKEVISKTYQHDEFLQQVITQRSTGKNKHAAIVGEPGAGKTTLLSAIASHIKDNTQNLPIFISLGSLQGMSLEDYLLKKWLPDAIRLVNPQFIPSSETENKLITCFYQSRVWLLLDAVDEMGEYSHVEALNKISRELTNWLEQARVVLTCRANVWDASLNNNILPGFDTYKTQDFQQNQIDEFIDKWFNCAENIQRGKELKAKLTEPGKERIRELVTNPLRLSLLCQIFYQNKQGELPETKAEIFQIYTRYFYHWKPELVPQDLIGSHELQQELHQALGKLALAGININSRNKFLNSQSTDRKQSHEDIWHCAQNMSYREFYHVWHSGSLSLQSLEAQFTDTHSILSQLQPTQQTGCISIIETANLHSDNESEIAQLLCTRICREGLKLPARSIPIISGVADLERQLLVMTEEYLEKQYLALVFDEFEPTETLINICRVLANTREIHIAFITDQPLEIPLKGFTPHQPNLLSAIQTWINEIE
ncbi:hypothetical protein NIES2100_34420 [Calothrix sp. NIES-2100]|uniref:Swt1 family HEPN domain-containing protein n=1 Tax=Calothrix sp. NIES-2100 TaxID=1954172 RepID=UPI000B5F44DF|nr:hypothetical protein NIES2100_34420 [Calothrix sp. NIES-2100]